MKWLLAVIFIGVAILALLLIFGLNDVTMGGVNTANTTANITDFDGTYELVSAMPLIIPGIFILIVSVAIWQWLKNKG